MKYYVYLLRCSDSSLYCGYTKNIENRVKAHNAGSASKYTRIRRPVKLCYVEEQLTLSDALKREYQIKQFSKIRKEELAKSFRN
jgi:putative endonuclease